MNYRNKIILVTATCLLTACGGGGGGEIDTNVRTYSDTFSALPQRSAYPNNNQYSQVKEQLGELLFWDPILSGDKNVACASCHHPDFGWADGRQLSIGSDGIGLGPHRQGQQVTDVNAPTILNTAFTGILNNGIDDKVGNSGYFWDLRAATLEEQSLGPLQNPVEMLGYYFLEDEILAEIISRLSDIPQYVELFEQSFGQGEITAENIAKAIATFERKLISPNSKFDAFIKGDISAFSPDEVGGLNKFIDVGCARCHLGPMLSDNLIHADEPVITTLEAVRTPSLRNISQSAPYMHDGSQLTLGDAIAFYEDRDDLQVTMDDQDAFIIEVFLKTLDTSNFYKSIPQQVPSGLTVGGEIN